MVSYYGKGADSGRTKATHGVTEDEDFFYIYTRTGVLESKIPKTDAQKYQDFLKTVQYETIKTRSGKIESKIRITPFTPYEIMMQKKTRY